MWTQTFEVSVKTEFKPDMPAQRALADAISEGAIGAAMAHECGSVSTSVLTAANPQQTIDVDDAKQARNEARTTPTDRTIEHKDDRPAVLPDGRHTVQCICDGRGIVPGPIGSHAKKCPGPERSVVDA